MAGPVRPPAVGLGAAPSWPARRPPHAVAHHQHQQGRSSRAAGAARGAAASPAPPCARRFTARRSGRRRTVAALATIPVPPPRPDGAAPRHQQQQLHALEADPPLLTGGAPPSGAVGPDLGWRLDFSESYIRGKLLGQGSFGAVYLGIDLRNGQEVAIKAMPKVRGKLTRQRTCEKLLKEASILAALQDCPGAVRLLGCYEQGDEVMVVTELCSGGDLQRLSDEAGALAERGAALVMYEALKVVKCCHDRGVLHGDVKPANFVLKHATRNPLRAPGDLDLLFTPWLRAIDFGCSQYVREERFGKRTGTPVYMAPEVFARDYGLEADIWSAGIMLYQLYARRFPYWETYEACRAARLEEVAALVAAGAVPLDYGPWRRMTPEGLDFVRSCLSHDHVDRMTVDEALDHAWFDAWLPSEGELAAAREQQAAAAAANGGGGGGPPPQQQQQQQQQQVAAAASLSAPLTPQQRLAASHDAQASMRARERERASSSVVLPAFSSSAAPPPRSSFSSGLLAPAPRVFSSSVETPFPSQAAVPVPALSGAVARAYANGTSSRAAASAAASAAPRPPPPPPPPRDPSTPAPPPPASPEPASPMAAAARAGVVLAGGGDGGHGGGSGPLQSSGGVGAGGGAAGGPPASAAAAAQQALRGALSWGAAAVAGARRAVTAQLEASAALGGDGATSEGDGDSSRQQQQQQQQQ